MTLQEAIEILKDYNKTGSHRPYYELGDAIKLGIEALKKIDELHANPVLGDNELLPGETEA